MTRWSYFAWGDPQGELSFRKVICDYLYQARGVKCDPHQIIVGAGNDYLLMMLCSVIGRNHVIAVENPAYKQAYRLFSSQSYPVEPIEMDRYGMRVDMLRESVADIAYVTPSHQYPTGIVRPMSVGLNCSDGRMNQRSAISSRMIMTASSDIRASQSRHFKEAMRTVK